MGKNDPQCKIKNGMPSIDIEDVKPSKINTVKKVTKKKK